MSKTARDLMTDPEFIEHDETVEKAAEMVKGIENTLIVRNEGEFVGEIHEHDLLKILVPENRLDEEKVIGLLGMSFDSRYMAETAEDLMNRHEITVTPEEEIGEIAFLMDKEEISSIPVEENGEIIGVVHENSLVKQI